MPDDLTRLLRPTPALDASTVARAKAARGQQFQAQWVRFPLSWLVALRQTKSGSVWQLALEVLFAEFRRQHTEGEIILSGAVTGLPHSTRPRAIRQLVRLGLIEVEQCGHQAVRVIRVHLDQTEAH